MSREGSRRWLRAAPVVGALSAGLLIAACAPHQEQAYQDETGNHDSPHPHTPEAGKSTPEPAGEVVRVRDEKERARMERYIAELVRAGDVVSTIELPSGEIVDCVAIDSQPGLRKPGGEGNVVQRQPPGDPRPGPESAAETVVGDPAGAGALRSVRQEYGSSGKTCPEKSVPIRRLTMEILDNFETLEDFLRARPGDNLTASANRPDRGERDPDQAGNQKTPQAGARAAAPGGAVELGMSQQEVVRRLGEPDRKAVLDGKLLRDLDAMRGRDLSGYRLVYTYNESGLQVWFQNGKVTGVTRNGVAVL